MPVVCFIMDQPPVKKLYRSREDRMIFGVCGGIGEYFAVDSNIIRLLWIIFGLTGAGIVVYILAAIIIPEAP
ncbi:MAG: PspC domain-containing protein [Methanomicrobiales archaeon]|nr:PspC domain-containing protein [Methanomicrobiales archaeon]